MKIDPVKARGVEREPVRNSQAEECRNEPLRIESYYAGANALALLLIH